MRQREGFHYRRDHGRRRRRRWIVALSLLGAVAAATVAAAVSGPSGGQGPTLAPPATRRPPHPARKAPRRPQFVTISFDGSGTADLWRYWRRVGRITGARFTFFLSGVYLLGEEHRSTYLPPQHEPGSSDIGFTRTRRQVRALLEQLALGHREGHEIATHFNGHFCGPYAGNVDGWTATDWTQEIAQFDELLARANELNGIRRPVALGFGPGDVVGARTPCFEGDLAVLHRVLRAHGFRYDSSASVPLGTRPRRNEGIWTFPLPEILLADTSLRVIAMDYNLLVNQEPDPSSARARLVENQAYTSYLRAFARSYYGARAPFAIGYHFERWSHGAYVRALTRFLRSVCRLRDVRCVPYVDVADWLERRPSPR